MINIIRHSANIIRKKAKEESEGGASIFGVPLDTSKQDHLLVFAYYMGMSSLSALPDSETPVIIDPEQKTFFEGE
jgi:hypothetical protein